jgi:hypothetical protein
VLVPKHRCSKAWQFFDHTANVLQSQTNREGPRALPRNTMECGISSSFWLFYIMLFHIADTAHPVLVPMRGFVGMKPWIRLHASFWDMGHIVIHQPVEGHDPPDRPHRDIRPGQQAPDPELAGIGMGLLQVIDLDHERQPDLADRGLGRPVLVY